MPRQLSIFESFGVDQDKTVPAEARSEPEKKKARKLHGISSSDPDGASPLIPGDTEWVPVASHRAGSKKMKAAKVMRPPGKSEAVDFVDLTEESPEGQNSKVMLPRVQNDYDASKGTGKNHGVALIPSISASFDKPAGPTESLNTGEETRSNMTAEVHKPKGVRRSARVLRSSKIQDAEVAAAGSENPAYVHLQPRKSGRALRSSREDREKNDPVIQQNDAPSASENILESKKTKLLDRHVPQRVFNCQRIPQRSMFDVAGNLSAAHSEFAINRPSYFFQRNLAVRIPQVYTMGFSKSGKKLAVAGADGIVQVVSAPFLAESPELFPDIEPMNIASLVWDSQLHESWVSSTVFATDEILCTSSNDGSISVLDATDGRLIQSLGYMKTHEGFGIYSLDVSSELDIVSCAKDGSLRLYKICNDHVNPLEYSRNAHKGVIKTVKWQGSRRSASRGIFASAGNDRAVRLWDARDASFYLGKPELQAPDAHKLAINSVLWHPYDLNRLVTASFKDIKVWDLRMFGTAAQTLDAHHRKGTARASSIIHPVLRDFGETVTTAGEGSQLLTHYSLRSGKVVSQSAIPGMTPGAIAYCDQTESLAVTLGRAALCHFYCRKNQIGRGVCY